MAIENPLPFSPHLVFGPFMIGFNAASILFGVLTVQYYLYHIRFPEDSSWIKCLALLIWLFELGHQVSISHSAYVIMITNYGNPHALFSSPQSIHSLSMFACAVSFTVRGFYIYRLWRFHRSWVLVIFLSMLSCASTGLYMYTTILGFIEPNLVLFGQRYSRFIISSGVLSACADVSVTFCMCMILFKQKRQGGVELTRCIVDRLILWSLESGLFPTIFIIGMAVSSGLWKDSFIWIAFWLVTCRAYSNSFFAMLNGRVFLRNLNANSLAVHTFDHIQSDLRSQPHVSLPGRHSSGRDIEMSKVIHVQSDFEQDVYNSGKV
ncbi:hypothetical protein DL96DRAFT_1197063 [Flagelloscypha sp. PMI_526]|nr:hypothetical protein DL96DRAFT_1197063 [Flagelloscypha sp. PMI_526]